MRRKLAALALAVSALTGGVGGVVLTAPPAAASECTVCGPGDSASVTVFKNKVAKIVAALRNGTLSQAQASAAIIAAATRLLGDPCPTCGPGGR